MLKRGQLSIFILLGIVLIIVVALVLSLQQPTLAPILPSDPLTAAASQLYACWDVHDIADMRLLGVQGGYADPQFGLYQGLVTTAYAVKSNEVLLPSRVQLENELETLVARSRQDCVDEVVLNNSGHGVVAIPGEDILNITITDSDVTIRTETTTTLTLNHTTRQAQPRLHKLQTRFGFLHERARDLASRSAIVPDSIDIVSFMEDIDVRIASVGATAYVVALTDITAPEPSGFWAAFDNEDGHRILTTPAGPTVETPRPITIRSGESSAGVIFASDPLGGPLIFETSSPLVLLDPDGGAYRITPTDFDIGTHQIPIDVYDSLGSRTRVILEVRVV